MLETLDHTIRIGSTPTFLYFYMGNVPWGDTTESVKENGEKSTQNGQKVVYAKDKLKCQDDNDEWRSKSPVLLL